MFINYPTVTSVYLTFSEGFHGLVEISEMYITLHRKVYKCSEESDSKKIKNTLED